MKHRVDVCFLVDCVISRPSRRTVSRWLRVSRHRKVWWFDFGIGLPFTASIGSDVFGECEASDNKGLPNYFVVTSKDITARITSTHPLVKMTKICALSLDKAFNFLVGRSLPLTLPLTLRLSHARLSFVNCVRATSQLTVDETFCSICLQMDPKVFLFLVIFEGHLVHNLIALLLLPRVKHTSKTQNFSIDTRQRCPTLELINNDYVPVSVQKWQASLQLENNK